MHSTCLFAPGLTLWKSCLWKSRCS